MTGFWDRQRGESVPAKPGNALVDGSDKMVQYLISTSILIVSHRANLISTVLHHVSGSCISQIVKFTTAYIENGERPTAPDIWAKNAKSFFESRRVIPRGAEKAVGTDDEL